MRLVRLASLLSLVLLAACGSATATPRPLVAASPVAALTLDAVVAEFRAHGLEVLDPGRTSATNTTPQPRASRLVRDPRDGYVALYEFATEEEARAFVAKQRPNIGRYAQRTIVIEYDVYNTTNIGITQPYLVTLATMH